MHLSRALRSPCPPGSWGETLFLLELASVEGRYLRPHQSILRDVRIRAAIRCGEEVGVCAPLNVHRIAHNQNVLGFERQPAEPTLLERLDESLEEFSYFSSTFH